VALNRTKAPGFKTIDKINFTKADKKKLSNNIPYYAIKAGVQEISRIDFIFDAGDYVQDKKLIADFTCSMLCEGTLNYASEEIAEKFDFLGTYVYYSSNKHKAVITLYSLNKHFDESLRLLKDIVFSATFPEHEFTNNLSRQKQQYLVQKEKVEVLAQRQFSESLFGADHPYGNIIHLADYDNISVDDLKQFFNKYYTAKNCSIIISGNIEENHFESVNKYFGNDDWNKEYSKKHVRYSINPDTQKKHFIKKDGAVQSAIRIGCRTINKTHKDYASLQVVNTILGGYFGSRLMKNLREEKGFTYGVGSGLISYPDSGYFVVVSQVGNQYVEPALEEIYKEIKLLKLELIPKEELKLVKNYMMGTILRNFDGPFALADSLKNILDYDLSYSYYTSFIKTVKNITSKKIFDLCNTYINMDDFYEIVVGG